MKRRRQRQPPPTSDGERGKQKAAQGGLPTGPGGEQRVRLAEAERAHWTCSSLPGVGSKPEDGLPLPSGGVGGGAGGLDGMGVRGQLGGSSRRTVAFTAHLLYAGALICHSKFKAKTSLLWREPLPQPPCKGYSRPQPPRDEQAEKAKGKASPASA